MIASWKLSEQEWIYLAALVDYESLLYVDYVASSDPAKNKLELSNCRARFLQEAWIDEDFSGKIHVEALLEQALLLCAKAERVLQRRALSEELRYERDGAVLIRNLGSGESCFYQEGEAPDWSEEAILLWDEQWMKESEL